MNTAKVYEKYPAGTVLLSNFTSLVIYGLSFLVMLKAGIIFGLIYLVGVIIMEIRLVSSHCVNCYYWGKRCAFGKGWISSLFFGKGNPPDFCKKEMTWTDMLPDILISGIPVIAGIILLILDFDLLILLMVIMLLIFISYGNSVIRGSLACNHCKQRELGCPAERLFSKD